MPRCISSILYLVRFPWAAWTKLFLWLPLCSFLACCTGLHCTMVLVPNLDPSHRTRTSYVNFQKESDTVNELPFPSLRTRKVITFPIVLFLDTSESSIILPGSIRNWSTNGVITPNRTIKWKSWKKKSIKRNPALAFSCYFKKAGWGQRNRG